MMTSDRIICPLALAAVAVCASAYAYEVKLNTSPDRVKTPLRVDMERIGAQEVRRNQARYGGFA